jgi:hypothetical protein
MRTLYRLALAVRAVLGIFGTAAFLAGVEWLVAIIPHLAPP